jgi:hypothetical protein
MQISAPARSRTSMPPTKTTSDGGGGAGQNPGAASPSASRTATIELIVTAHEHKFLSNEGARAVWGGLSDLASRRSRSAACHQAGDPSLDGAQKVGRSSGWALSQAPAVRPNPAHARKPILEKVLAEAREEFETTDIPLSEISRRVGLHRSLMHRSVLREGWSRPAPQALKERVAARLRARIGGALFGRDLAGSQPLQGGAAVGRHAVEPAALAARAEAA